MYDSSEINDQISVHQTICAAEKPNPTLVEANLAYHAAYSTDETLPIQRHKQIERTISGAIHVLWESPLTAAIRANTPHNDRPGFYSCCEDRQSRDV